MRRYAIILLLSAFPLVIGANGNYPLLDEWYKNNVKALQYLDIKQQLLDIFNRAEEACVPGELLLEKLNEGAARDISSNRLLLAMEEELERLASIVLILMANPCYNTVFSDNLAAMDTMKQLSFIVRGGLNFKVLKELLDYACVGNTEMSKTFYMLKALIRIPAVTTLSDSELLNLGKALLDSSMPPENYSIVASIYLKGRNNQVNYSVITEIIIDSLRQNKGLVQIEQEIIRRGRK